MNGKQKTVGVVLSGCGHLDGAEIREAVFSLLVLDQLQVEVKMMAPSVDQHHVINHLGAKEQTGQERNVLQESARIARGDIQDLNVVDPSSLDALVLPGGFGAAKNLSSFAFEGANGKLIPEFEKLILAIRQEHRPIGAICISPAVLALAFGKDGYTCTIGNDSETAKAIGLTGGGHVSRPVTEIYHDETFNVVSTPAYMYGDARPSEVFAGIEKCLHKVVSLAQA